MNSLAGVLSEDLRARDDRLRWHCRRALLELDIVFARFWAAQGEQALTDAEAAELEALLALEDYPLWYLLSQGAEGEQGKAGLLHKLRTL